MGDVSTIRHVNMTSADLAVLRIAVQALEHQNLASRLSGMIGTQVSFAARVIPAPVQAVVASAATAAMKFALRAVLASVGKKQQVASNFLHKAMAAASGAAGGLFGAASLPVELPVSTSIMLRSIADIARSEGEDLSKAEGALACIEVFALGGHSDEALEGGYFAMRAFLAKSVTDAAKFMVQRGVADQSAPVVVKFIAQVAARFGVVVSEKVAAQAVPVIGALGGAVVNYAFIDHFQSLARGHFIVRRLEREYGQALVKGEYERARREMFPA